MTSSKPAINGFNTERLFITGVGEVDARVLNRLREAGDKVCGEVETECVSEVVRGRLQNCAGYVSRSKSA